jgi:hypothetical protein
VLPKADATETVGRRPKDGLQASENGVDGVPFGPMSEVVLDLHGARARKGVDIDAFETFLTYFRSALREFDRATQGSIPRKSGRPAARDNAASAFRLVAFKTGSGVATLEPSLAGSTNDDLVLDDAGTTLAVTTLHSMLSEIEAGQRLPSPVVEALDSARRAIGDDGSFGVELRKGCQMPRVVIDRDRIERLSQPIPIGHPMDVTVTGRLHMIEADPPNRRVQVRGQDGTDWTGLYPDRLHDLVLTLIERVVRVTGEGRRLSPMTGRLQISELEPIPHHSQDALFSVETIPVADLQQQQHVDRPQGLASLVDRWPDDDDEALQFLEATLGS